MLPAPSAPILDNVEKFVAQVQVKSQIMFTDKYKNMKISFRS